MLQYVMLVYVTQANWTLIGSLRKNCAAVVQRSTGQRTV